MGGPLKGLDLSKEGGRKEEIYKKKSQKGMKDKK